MPLISQKVCEDDFFKILRFKFIPYAPHGDQMGWKGGVFLDFFAQPANVNCDRTRIDIIGHTPDAFQHLIAGKNLPGMQRQVI